MNLLLAQWLLAAAAVYGLLGLLFAVPFVWRGVDRIDSSAHGAGWGFRIVVVPGVILLWPLLLERWQRARSSAP
ncbi:MAG: hypothetical protein ABI609_18450 [Acidobacteriota bacterium]